MDFLMILLMSATPLPVRIGIEIGGDEQCMARVLSIDPQGPAASSALKKGDCIVCVNTKPIEMPFDVREALRSVMPGAKIVLALENGATVEVLAAPCLGRVTRAGLPADACWH